MESSSSVQMRASRRSRQPAAGERDMQSVESKSRQSAKSLHVLMHLSFRAFIGRMTPPQTAAAPWHGHLFGAEALSSTCNIGLYHAFLSVEVTPELRSFSEYGRVGCTILTWSVKRVEQVEAVCMTEQS